MLFVSVFFAFTAFLTNFSIFTSWGKVGNVSFEEVHLVFESSHSLFRHQKLWWRSLLENSNRSGIVLPTACLVLLILHQTHKEIWNEHEKKHLYQQLEVASGIKQMYCKEIYPRCYKRRRETNNMSWDMCCRVLLFDLMHQDQLWFYHKIRLFQVYRFL